MKMRGALDSTRGRNLVVGNKPSKKEALKWYGMFFGVRPLLYSTSTYNVAAPFTMRAHIIKREGKRELNG